MSTDNDIVPRMRLWAEGLQNQKAIVLAVAITEAADEIERLRNERNAFESERDELVRISNKLKHERDEARRSVCEMSIQLGGVYRRVGGKPVEVTTPEGCAEIMRWDCFKEKA